MLVEVAATHNRDNFLKEILNESCGQNLFLIMSDQSKLAFVRDILTRFAHVPDIARDALAQKFYAPYLLLTLIERDQFRKITDYTYYETCLNIVTQYELEEMSKNPEHGE